MSLYLVLVFAQFNGFRRSRGRTAAVRLSFITVSFFHISQIFPHPSSGCGDPNREPYYIK